METPPRSAYTDASNRLQQAATAMRPGTVTLGGVEYDCAAAIQAETLDLTERGLAKVQRVEVLIPKCMLSTAPRQGQPMSTGNLGFKIVEVRGHNDWETRWHLIGERTPGADTPAAW